MPGVEPGVCSVVAPVDGCDGLEPGVVSWPEDAGGLDVSPSGAANTDCTPSGAGRGSAVTFHCSGRADASAFHLEAGRLCVMLSRHRVACFVLARTGIWDLLLRYAPTGDRVLGIDGDPEFEGWRAHVGLLDALRRRGRVVPVAPAPRTAV